MENLLNVFAEEKETAAKTEEAVTDISLDPRHFLQVETMALPQVSADFVEILEDTSREFFVSDCFQCLVDEEHLQL